MFHVAQILTAILVAVAMALSLAHALELPGKMRLARESYLSVQSVYYPGFTIGGGIGEVGGTIATIILLFLTPTRSADFWLTLVALLGLIGMQAVYWRFTHPINNLWLQGEKLGRFGGDFFSFGTDGKTTGPAVSWTELRNRWEYSHVVRAGLAAVSFIALLVAVSLGK